MKHKFIKEGKPHWTLRLKIPILIALMLLTLPCISFAQEPGDSLWTKIYGGSSHDHGFSVQQTDDGGYIMAGKTSSFGAGVDDFYLVKTNADGDTSWTRTYGGEIYDRGYSVQQTTDGGYIVAGHTNSFGAGNFDAYLVKTDTNGDTIWTCTHGGSNTDYCFSVQETEDSCYICCGSTSSWGCLVV
jgi:hypothetical protein